MTVQVALKKMEAFRVFAEGKSGPEAFSAMRAALDPYSN